VAAWVIFDSPQLGFALSLSAHFIGGVPTICRVLKNPDSEQAYHWYFFFTGCIISIFANGSEDLKTIIFPLYFTFFDGLIILLANRSRFFSHKTAVEKRV
jgi:hypothetical protein